MEARIPRAGEEYSPIQRGNSNLRTWAEILIKTGAARAR